jgi:hypothetical protein
MRVDGNQAQALEEVDAVVAVARALEPNDTSSRRTTRRSAR